MNHLQLLIPLTATLLVAACSKSYESSPSSSVTTSAPKSVVQAPASITPPAQALVGRTQFVADKRIQLSTMEKDLTRLAERLDKGSPNEKVASSPKLEALREQARQLARQLDALDKSNEVMWPELKAAYDQTSALMQEALTQARQWSPETVTP